MERDTRVWAYCADVPAGQIFDSEHDVPEDWVDSPANIEEPKPKKASPPAKIEPASSSEPDPDEDDKSAKSTDPTFEDLKAKAKELGIKHHHAAGIPKLTELIEAHTAA